MKRTKFFRRSNAAVSLEACIVLTLFIFFVLTLYSFFSVFEVQGKVSSAMMQCAQSLAVDTYNIDRIYVDFDEEEHDELSFPAYLVSKLGLEKSVINDYNVTKDNKWFKTPAKANVNQALKEVIKKRFIAYLTDEGTDEAAKELLTRLRVDGDIDGFDFSNSEIDADNNLIIRVSYRVGYVFDCPSIGLQPLEFNQSTSSRLWREKEATYQETTAQSASGSSGGGHSSGGGSHDETAAPTENDE